MRAIAGLGTDGLFLRLVGHPAVGDEHADGVAVQSERAALGWPAKGGVLRRVDGDAHGKSWVYSAGPTRSSRRVKLSDASKRLE
jgi:hypothetical protein